MPIYKMDGKKDNKQKYRVFVNYVDGAGKYQKKSKIVYGMDEAKECERLLSSQIKEDKPIAKMTVQNFLDEYIANKKHEVRQSSLEKSQRILKNHIVPHLGTLKLEALNAKKLQEWKTLIAEKDISVKTKQNIYKELHAFLNYGVKLEYFPRNPLDNIGNFKDVYFESETKKFNYYTAEEFKNFISVAKANCHTLKDFGVYVFFNIAFYTGMRKGEINALKWSDIEDDKYIHVRRSVSQKIKGCPIVETPPKNKSSYRTLQMPQPLIEILHEHRKRYGKVSSFTEDFRVCGGASCISDTSLSDKNRYFAEEAHIPSIRIHDFRHSHASLLANEGINIQEIARRLGHSDVKMTWNTYSHLYPREEERALKILNEIR